MRLESSRRTGQIDIDWIKANEAKEYRYTTSKKDVGREMIIAVDRLKKLVASLDDLEEETTTKNHEIGQASSKFHTVEPKKPYNPKELLNYLKTLPMMEDEEEQIKL